MKKALSSCGVVLGGDYSCYMNSLLGRRKLHRLLKLATKQLAGTRLKTKRGSLTYCITCIDKKLIIYGDMPFRRANIALRDLIIFNLKTYIAFLEWKRKNKIYRSSRQ